jgi:hypothetical protein
MATLTERGVEQLGLKTPSYQTVVTPDRLLLFLKALTAQPGAEIDPTKFVFGGHPYLQRVFIPGARKGGPPQQLETMSTVPPRKIAIEIEYQTDLNLFWPKVRILEDKQNPPDGKFRIRS